MTLKDYSTAQPQQQQPQVTNFHISHSKKLLQENVSPTFSIFLFTGSYMRYISRVLLLLNHPQIIQIITSGRATSNTIFICETIEKFNTEGDVHLGIYHQHYKIKSMMLCYIPQVQVWKLTFSLQVVFNSPQMVFCLA